MRQFFDAVLPATGNYVIHTDNKKYHRNIHAADLQDLEQQTLSLDARPDTTVWYALAAYKDNVTPSKVGRSAAEADRFKTLAFDVDPKDRLQNVLYATQRDMAATTLAACATIGLPDPMFVSSGNGLHCYFPLTVEISKDMWLKISTLLKEALLHTGMALDTGKICDASMVLRAPGTSNKKATGSKPVVLLSPITLHDPLVLAGALQAYCTANKLAATTKTPPAKRRTSAVMDAILNTQFPPADAGLIEKRCNQISIVAQCAGNVHYDMWRASLGIAKHCVDGLAVAHRWSSGHPTYDIVATEEKYEGWNTPPTTCEYFEGMDKAGCAGCPHRGSVTSPVQLGFGVEQGGPVVVEDVKIHMPATYTIKENKIWRIFNDEAKHVSDYVMFPSERFRDEATGKSMCLVECQIPVEGWHTFELSMDTLSALSEFQIWLMNNQLFVNSPATLDAMRRYMLTYLQELQQLSASNLMCNSFGWRDQACTEFVLGNRLISRDGSRVIRLASIANDIAPSLVPAGSREQWIKATEMFNQPKMQTLGLAFLMSVGSPLMVGSGLKSVLVNLYSENSGTGKTTTGLMANSVYGNPDKLKMTVQDTDNALFKTMGVYGNLPVYIDEITTIGQDKPGRLSSVVFFITQGREKIRMDRGGGLQSSVEWESITLSSSNKNLYNMLNATSFEGESMRVFQMNVPDTDLFRSATGGTFGYQMSQFLGQNYGLVGEEFVQGIIRAGGPHSIYRLAREEFIARYNFAFNGAERFWMAAFVVAYATGKLCNALGLTNIDIDSVIKAGFDEVHRLRGDLVGEKLDCFEMIGQFIGEVSAKTVMHTRNTILNNEGSVAAPYPHEAVARVEATCTHTSTFTGGKLFVAQVQFNKWCTERGTDRKTLFKQLTLEGVSVEEGKRVAMMRGTDKTLPAVRAYEIDLGHPRFQSIMQQTRGAQADHLKLVKPSGESHA